MGNAEARDMSTKIFCTCSVEEHNIFPSDYGDLASPVCCERVRIHDLYVVFVHVYAYVRPY